MALLLNMTLRSARTGGRPVSEHELPALLRDCLRDEPMVRGQEDFLPQDPREVVLARAGHTLVRLFPGSVERPVADIARWALVAEAVDRVLIRRLGFGVNHYVELALRYTDHVIGMLAPSWPAGDDLAERVTAVELEAAATLMDTPIPPRLRLTPEMRAAASWATAASPRVLPFDLNDRQSIFGRHLAVDLPQTGGAPARTFWLPPAWLPEATGYGVVELSTYAHDDIDANMRFAQVAADQVRRALHPFSDAVYGAPDLSDGPCVSPKDAVQWIARCGDNRAIAVQLFTSLSGRSPRVPGEPAAVRAARTARRYPDRLVSIELAVGTARLEAGLEIVPLLVFASPGHIAVRQLPEAASMSLDDLLWAASTMDNDTDLFLFCREMASPRRPQLHVFEAVNIWQSWQANGKSLHPGAVAPTLISVAPHQADEEWSRSAGRAALEQTLTVLDLPPVRDWASVAGSGDGPFQVYGWSTAALCHQAWGPVTDERFLEPVGWTLHTGPVPMALRCLQPDWTGNARDLLHDLAGAFAFAIGHIADTWAQAHAGSGVTGYVIDLEPTEAGEPAGDPLAVASVGRGDGAAPDVVTARLVVDWATFGDLAAADSGAGRDMMAAAMRQVMIGAGLSLSVGDAVARAWQAIAPTIQVDINEDTSAAAQLLASPWPIDEALVSAADRVVAAAVRAAGVQPGTYHGAEAKKLDRDVLAPAALTALTRLLARYDVNEVVAVGMRQLDRAVADKRRRAADIQRARRMTLTWDPIAHAEDIDRTHLTLRRCSETVVEAALRTQPSGSAPVDKLAYMEIIAAAHAYLQATNRSELVHHQLNPTALTISESFAIRTAMDSAATGAGASSTYRFDADAYRHARLTDLLGPAKRDADDDTAAAEAAVLTTIDDAMLRAYGTSGTDLLTTLLALTRWPVTTEGDHIARADTGSVIQHVLDTTVLGEQPDGPDRVRAAVDLLTSSTTTMNATDWKPWHARNRQHRLLTQPLVAGSDGVLAISPHLCYAVFTVYGNYLSQGLLPWTQPPPRPPVDKALDKYRDRRNRQLEHNVAALLTDAGYIVRERIKPSDPQRLGVPELSTEIDAVAGRPGSYTLWLLEAKDPADTVATPEVRRHLDTFYTGHRKSPAYAAQLDRKLADLQPHAAQVAVALGLPPAEPDSSYEVKAMFVTRRPVPASFVGSGYRFTTLTTLLNDLSTPAAVRDHGWSSRLRRRV
ncbi:hypothetical protein [Micromonospora sp. NRRL B-16802]|uniref:hypothetical protein n=1 Tax=Micromonospora sp. NRRL B-16802 TaxID=1415541 RepID=UPI0006B06D1B|nr:hypothetical protein [Micromonospora sp. NRRL B-16802]